MGTRLARLIAIEGIDGSGKGTQARRLQERLARQGRSACLLSFPRYEATRFGRAVGQFLDGQFGPLDSVHPQLASLLFAGDRFESKSVIAQATRDHEVVIFDRYVASNVAHQAARLPEPERTQLVHWIEDVEYGIFGLPQPERTILLDLPAATAQQLIALKSARSYTSKSADLHERDHDYLERVRHVYRELAGIAAPGSRASGRCDWECVSCVADGRLRTVEEIADELWDRTGLESTP
jgi:dTMP kinase